MRGAATATKGVVKMKGARSNAKTGDLRLLVVAGEASGDAVAAEVLRAIFRERPDLRERLMVRAVAGPAVQRTTDLDVLLFHMQELAVMGLGNVLKRLPALYTRLRQVEDFAKSSFRPHVVLSIDAKGFNLRLQQRLAGTGCHRMHVVGPSPWALRPLLGPNTPQPRNLAHVADHLFLLMPFEQSWFSPQTLTTCIGHPALQTALPDAAFAPWDASDRALTTIRHEDFQECVSPASYAQAHPPLPWQRLSLPRRDVEANVVAFFPGSRLQELQWSLPLALRLAELMPSTLEWCVSSTPVTAGPIADFLAGQGEPAARFRVVSDREDLCRRAQAAIAVSGTIVVELAVSGVPSIAIYDADWLTRRAARHLARVDHVSLPNILADEAIIPEFVFEECTADRIAPALRSILAGGGELPSAAQTQSEGLQQVLPHFAVWDETSRRPCRPADIVAQALIRRFDHGADL